MTIQTASLIKYIIQQIMYVF